MIYFVLKSKLRKMTFDVIMTWFFRYPTSHGNIMVIFGFSVSKYVCLVTFGKRKFANFQSLGPLLGPSHAKIKVITEVMYHSVPSLTTPGDLHFLTARGNRFSPNYLCLGSGFELGKFSTV